MRTDEPERTIFKCLKAWWHRQWAWGSFLVLAGYMLSPLSWWNDLFINVPLAWVFASLISLFYHPAYAASFVVGYWLTNVLGFVLMHKGGHKIFSKDQQRYSWKWLARDLLISLLYTGLVVLLVRWKLVQPLADYSAK